MRNAVGVSLGLTAIFIAYACATEDPISSECINALDCGEGYDCVDGACVPLEGSGDIDVRDEGHLLPDETVTDTGTPEEGFSDEENDEFAEIESDVPLDAGDGEFTPDDNFTPENDLTPDTDPITSCDGITCGGHGTCKVEGGTVICKCYGGYQDKDGDLICLPDCANSGLECGSTTHTVCDDSSGVPQCICEEGYQDNDSDKVCKPTCATAGLTCTGGTCNDSSGTARCVCTDSNYQDNDNNGTCEPTCAKALGDGTLSCTTHAHCDDSSGTATCVCNDGYINPPACSTCAPNFHSDGSGNCLPNQSCTPTYCNGHGTCSDASGMPVCTCDTGYTGTTCNQCASGYQDSDGNGTCLEDCYFSCGQKPIVVCPKSYGSCQYSGGVATCVCEQGWENPLVVMHTPYPACIGGTFSLLPECSQCKITDPPAMYPDGCPATCSDANLTCQNGKCYYDKNTKDIYCKCNSGYTYNPTTTNCE